VTAAKRSELKGASRQKLAQMPTKKIELRLPEGLRIIPSGNFMAPSCCLDCSLHLSKSTGTIQDFSVHRQQFC
jgi:hypothetical protein